MSLKKLIEVTKNGELGWKLPKKLYLIRNDINDLFYVRNKNLKERLLEDREYRNLRKKYHNYIDKYDFEEKQSVVNRTVWICWLQGLENAPDLVKACVNSVKQNLKDFKIVILTEDNISDYVSFPKHIMEKYKKGIISRTHFSDILRVALLAQYGGLWIDSTVLCTDGDFADYIIKLPIFAYKVMNLDRNDEEAIVCSSWLISARSHNPILMLTRDLVYEYWKTHKYVTNFFLIHLLFAMAARKYNDIWKDVPMFNNRSPHTLMFELGDEYSEERWKQIEKISSFHKLTRHFDYNIKNSNYKHIMEIFL